MGMRAMALVVGLMLGMLGAAPTAAQSSGCVAQSAGDAIAGRLIDDLRIEIRDEMKQSLRQFAMQCLARIIEQAGGLGRLNVGGVIRGLIRRNLDQLLDPLRCGGGGSGGMAGAGDAGVTVFEALAAAAHEPHRAGIVGGAP